MELFAVMMNRETTKTNFIPGLKLAEACFREAVGPIVDKHFPDLRYTAALIGCGSEILGYDTEMSTDHHWGPRAMIFLPPENFDADKHRIEAVLADELPLVFRGYSTNWTKANPNDNGVRNLEALDSGPINHLVEMFTLRGFFVDYLDIDIETDLRPADWLTLPHQKLRSIVAGGVFRDDLGLAAIRERFAWYPHDVWLYVLASCWSRVGEEEHLMGRAGHVGDEIGSALIASRLVRDVMRLAFLMERVYPPYPKWFGTAFRELECAEELAPPLTAVLNAQNWRDRESNLCHAYEIAARMHNRLDISDPLAESSSQFFGRPFRIIDGGKFASALKACIQGPAVKSIAERRLIGNIDLLSDNTDLLEDPARRMQLLNLYEG
jgi:hypothetical protein